MPDNFDEFDHDSKIALYRGAAPNLIDLQILKDVFNIERIISLDAEIAVKIGAAVANLGIEHVIIPMSFLGPNNSEDFLEKLDFVKNNIKGLFNKNTYVHCKHGSDRTGITVALYRLLINKWNIKDIVAEMLKYNFGVKASFEFSDFVMNYLYKVQESNDVNDNYDDLEKAYDASFFGNDPGGVVPIANSQPSFALIEPIPFGSMIDDINKDLQMKVPTSKIRKDYLKRIHDNSVSELPMVGYNESYPGIRGIGPVENIGFVGFP